MCQLCSDLVVVDYDPSWKQTFEAAAQKIQDSIGKYIFSVDHVGSTNIPGLAAKPICDIQIVVKDFSNLDKCIPGMEELGYKYWGLMGIEGREYFNKPGYHVHMVEEGNDEHMRKKLFLGYLREHSEAREAYGALKKELAKKWNGIPEGCHKYNVDKTEFIMDVLEKAGWDPERKPLYLRELGL